MGNEIKNERVKKKERKWMSAGVNQLKGVQDCQVEVEVDVRLSGSGQAVP